MDSWAPGTGTALSKMDWCGLIMVVAMIGWVGMMEAIMGLAVLLVVGMAVAGRNHAEEKAQTKRRSEILEAVTEQGYSYKKYSLSETWIVEIIPKKIKKANSKFPIAHRPSLTLRVERNAATLTASTTAQFHDLYVFRRDGAQALSHDPDFDERFEIRTDTPETTALLDHNFREMMMSLEGLEHVTPANIKFKGDLTAQELIVLLQLAKLQDGNPIKCLTKNLRDPLPNVRYESFLMLAGHTKKKGYAQMAQRLKRDENPVVALRAAVCLGEDPVPLVKDLLNRLDESQFGEKGLPINGLVDMTSQIPVNDPQLTAMAERLIHLANQATDPIAHAHLTFILAALRHPIAKAWLMDHLKTVTLNDPKVASFNRICDLLGRFGTVEDVATLRVIREESMNRLVRNHLDQAITTIQARSSGEAGMLSTPGKPAALEGGLSQSAEDSLQGGLSKADNRAGGLGPPGA